MFSVSKHTVMNKTTFLVFSLAAMFIGSVINYSMVPASSSGTRSYGGGYYGGSSTGSHK